MGTPIGTITRVVTTTESIEYDDVELGVISIDTDNRTVYVTMRYLDDGRVIKEELISLINEDYDRFITTNLGFVIDLRKIIFTEAISNGLLNEGFVDTFLSKLQ